MGLLQLEDLGDRLQEKRRTQARQVRREALSVVAEPNDVAHDPLGAVRAEGANEARVLLPDPVGRVGEVESHNGDAERLQSRTELHGLAGTHDPVRPGDHQRAACGGRSKNPVDQIGGIGRQPAALEHVDHTPEPQSLERRLPHRPSHVLISLRNLQ